MEPQACAPFLYAVEAESAQERKEAAANPQPLAIREKVNQSWSMDFTNDALADGPRFRRLNDVGDFDREALGIEIGLSLPARRVMRMVDQLPELHGDPEQIRLDKGPEFIGVLGAECADKHRVHLEFIEAEETNAELIH